MAEAVDDRDTDEMKTPLVSCCENSDNGGGGGDCSKADGGGCCAADTNHAGCSQPEKAVSTKTGCENAACGAACQARRLQQMKKLQELREARRWHRGDFDGLYTTSLKRDEEDGGSTAVPAIVWSCLPGITAFLPFVGHAGLLRSDGALLDFAFSYVFNLDMPAFGKPIRILSLEPFMRASAGAASCDFVRVHDGSDTTSTTTTTGGSDLKDEGRFVSGWDKILSEAVRRYQNERYAFFTHNCHTFTAHCLNKAKIPGPFGLPWNMVTVAGTVFLRSRFVTTHAVITRVGFTSAVALCGYLIFGVAFFTWWAIAIAVVLAYFSGYTYLYQWKP